MLFSYNWLQSFFDKKLPAPEKLVDVLTARAFEAKVVKEISISSEVSDKILDIDVLPNRTHDCYSHLGIAKEISALLDVPFKTAAKAKLNISKGEKAGEFLSLDVGEPNLCRRYIAGVMTGIKVGPSPKWMQDRLTAIGQKTINNIVDCANYVMLEIGQPLHAFDMDKINPAKIVVRKAKKGEKITTLDNRNLELDENVLVIADSSDPLAIAGIKGGKKAEISEKTKNIIIESANFDPVSVRSTSQKIGLRTGASVGFENEISPYLAETAMERVMSLIQETGGGKIIGGNIDFYPKKFIPAKIIFKPADVSKLLGVSVSEKEIISTLQKLNFEIKKATRLPARQEGAIIAVGPAERLDLNIKEDVIEEIARIRGYEKISAKVPEGFLIPALRNNRYYYENIIRDLMVSVGFSEVYNYSFSPVGEVEIENPIAGDKKFMRINILDALKDGVKKNFRYFDEVRIFEIGKVFRNARLAEKSGVGVIETNKLAGVAVHKKEKSKKESFYEIKGVLESLFSGIGISDYWFDDTPKAAEAKADYPMGIAEIKIGNEGIGFVDYDSFEIDLERLIAIANEEIEFRPVSKYPAIIRDISVLVPTQTRVTEVNDIIENAGGELLIDADLFDIFEGDELGENMKNFAFHLVFQSQEKTLNDKEVNAIMEKVIKDLDGVKEWEVRK